jgi:hypothetical protein
MLGFTLLHCDDSTIELLHVKSGVAFTFPVADGKLTDKYNLAPDLSGDFLYPLNIDDSAVIERLAALARMAAGLHLPAEPGRRP